MMMLPTVLISVFFQKDILAGVAAGAVRSRDFDPVRQGRILLHEEEKHGSNINLA